MKIPKDHRDRFNRIAWRHGWPSLSDPNPFPRFRLFRRSRPQVRRCTGDPCICTNGIGCVTIPVEMW